MSRFAFVVLNYQCTQDTIRCIESIEKLDYKEKYIVVVDNASCDQPEFFESLKKRFADEDNISYISSSINTGYARGNNCGIDYARRVLNADYVCVVNPDCVLNQKDFIQNCQRLYEQYGYVALGPRILSHGRDGNPLGRYSESAYDNLRGTLNHLRIYLIKKYGLNRFNIVKRLRRYISERKDVKTFDLNVAARLEVGLDNASNDDKSKSHQNKSDVSDTIVREGTYVLSSDMGLKICGACIIFSPAFFSVFTGLGNRTFLYCEENILSCVCYHLGYNIIYSSEVIILHEGGKSTRRMQENELDEDKKIMKMELICTKAVWELTRVLAHKNDKRYLKKVLNPKVDPYAVLEP